MRTNPPMYIQYFWRKVFSGWGFITSPSGVSGGGARNSGKGGFAAFLSKTVVFKCFTFLEKFLTEVAGENLFFDLVWGQEPS